MTTLEAHVAPENWSILEQAYRDATMRGRPAEMLQTYLIQSVSDPTLWRIVVLWPSREALDAYRQSVRTRAVSKCSAPPARNRL
jgi:quinol monooxygenase YgiN